MKTMASFTVIAAGLIFASLSGVSAKEINQRPHLDPGSQAKVNSVMAGARRKRGTDHENFRRTVNTGCGGLTVGDFSDSRRPPREIIIVARDIINVSRNC